MTVTQKHAEWISLLDISGPFLAVPILEDTFPQGLDKVETPFRQRLRSAYDEWSEAVDEAAPDVEAIHQEWMRLVLRDFLEYEASVLKSGDEIPPALQHHDALSGITIRPDFAVMAGDKAKLLVSVCAPGTDLKNPPSSDAWLASPAERLIALCRACEVPLGLLTNGDQWMLISAPADGGSSCASWYARLWFQEPVTLQAFYSLLGVRRCFGEATQTLDALIEKSAGHQDEVTDTLGEQVRRAVEVLVQALDRADLDRNRTLLKDVTPTQLFEAGLTVMMRLVVVLCAEERGLLLLGEPVYDQNYAISTLRSQLVEQASHGLEILERRQDAWSRLLATFRGIYGGISHETLRLPPLGGSLFDPDRFPFLEGREPGSSWLETPAIPLPIDNRTVLLLLNALQVLEHRSGAQLLSYESLDVEQIGHVYEGLLERTVKRVPEVTLSLEAASAVRKKTGHPELHLSELEAAAATGKAKFEAFLFEATGRSKTALSKALTEPLPQMAANRLLASCGGELTLNARVKPFALLLRTDSWGDPLVYPANAFVVTHGAGRRETGSHYTPKSLTEPIVLHTLEPLVYIGPAEGKLLKEWELKSPAELLALKVCDMAMGSGAFLVQTCRYLAERLVEAWEAEEKAGHFISIEGEVLDNPGGTELLPSDQGERVLIARRLVASRCLYGVDINPMAVELAKLSLWLVTMMKGRPFNFLDHALKCGDSLLGVSSIQQIENFSLRSGDRQVTFATANLAKSIEEASAKRRALEDLPSNDHTQIETKNRLHAEAEVATGNVKGVADCLIAFELRGLDGKAYEDQRTAEAEKVQLLMKHLADATLNFQTSVILQISRCAHEQTLGRRPFHWPLEFPEVFQKNGFDALVGNPPFMGGRLIGRALSEEYQRYLVLIRENVKGSPDLCSYFFLRSHELLREAGAFGLIATKSIAETGTRQVCLDRLLARGSRIFHAQSRLPWPGTAFVLVSIVHVFKGKWQGSNLLNGSYVKEIDGGLSEPMNLAEVFKLPSMKGTFSQGQDLMGLGFELDSSEKDAILIANPRCAEVIRPLFKGDDIANSPTLAPYRWAIYFRRMHEDAARRYEPAFSRVQRLVKPFRDQLTGQIHEKCFWKFWDFRPRLVVEMDSHEWMLALPRVSKFFSFRRVPTGNIYNEKTKLLFYYEWSDFAVLQSSIHQEWVYFRCGTLGVTINYSTSAALETWPMPIHDSGRLDLNAKAEAYHGFREGILRSRNEGLTDVYNRFHDRGEQSADIARLRALHEEMDQAVAAAYGWSDLDLGHGFHATKQGERYTISESARREILDRLLSLNHQRYEQEVKAGLHDKKGSTKRKSNPVRLLESGMQELNLDDI